MSFEQQKFYNPGLTDSSGQNEKHLNLSDLDVKGREIFGLEPKLEKFSRLVSGEDFTLLKKNEAIQSEKNLDEAFIFVNPTGGTESRLVQAPHWRTISQDQIHASLETDYGSEFYYTVDTKGVGYLKPTLKGDNSLDEYQDWNRTDEYGYKNAYGLADKEDFFTSEGDLVEKSKQLTNEGLRTELYYAIGELKNVCYQGKLTPVEELRKKKIIPSKKELTPEMGIRLLKINTRIAEVKDSDEKRAKELFAKAFDVFNKESQDKKLDLPEVTIGDLESEKLYFQEFFKRMGQNIAVLQNIGYIGWHMHSANVTLAAEIVDIGPYESWQKCKDDEEFVKEYAGVRRGVWKDMRDIAYGLKFLIQSGEQVNMTVPNANDLVDSYFQSCFARLDESRLQTEQMVDQQAFKEALTKVTKAVLLENKKLASLKHGSDVDDWNII